MIPHAAISIATLKDTMDWSFGQRLFETLIEHDVRFTPRKIGADFEAYEFDGIDSIRRYWGRIIEVSGVTEPDFHLISPRDLMWKGVNPIRRGVNYYRWKNLTDDGTIVNGIFIVDGIFDSTLRWDGLFKKLCELYEGFWGCLHIVTDHEGRLSPNGVVRSDYCLPIRSGAYSARSIPNLTCLNFIRDDMVDPEIWPRIEAAGFPVERFLDGHLLQVTPGFDDLLTDFPNFSRRRAELKTFFPPDLFLIKDEPPLSD